MGFFLMLIYLIATYLSPADLFPSLAPLRPMLLLGALAIAASINSFISNAYVLRCPQLHLLAGFTAALALSRVLNGSVGGGVGAVLEFVIPSSIFYLMLPNVQSLTRLRIVAGVLVALALYLSIIGATAYHTGYGGDLFVMQQNTDMFDADGNLIQIPRVRGLGFLNDPNDLAQSLLLVLPFLGLAWRRKMPGKLLVPIIPAGIILYGIFLTHSRGAVMGLLVMAALALRDRLSATKAAILTIALGLVIVALNFTGGRSISLESGTGRIAAWREGIHMFRQSPIWGIGYDRFTQHYEQTAHNSFVLCFAESGVFGYFFWLGLIVVSAFGLSAVAKLPPKESYHRDLARWAKAVRLSLFTFLATSWFLSRTYIITFYLLVGMAAVLTEMTRNLYPGDARFRFKIPWFAVTAVAELATIAAVYFIVKLHSVI